MNPSFQSRVQQRDFAVGVVGLGYVGLPLVLAFCEEGFRTVGFDVDQRKVDALSRGQSYIKHIPTSAVEGLKSSGRFTPTTDFSMIEDVDAVLICVPTPLTIQREPDMSYIVNTAEQIQPHLKKDHLIILESTTYPGTTDDVLLPILEQSGLKGGRDFCVAYSPEREDPGNPVFSARKIPKVVGGLTEECRERAAFLYGQIVVQVVPVSSTRTAEAVKLTENIFRCINIALVNELKVIYSKMDIDVWEVIDAAKSKPFGFMPFYPGPGLGGHCIPIDPFYLTWKAREYDCPTRFIELAGEINVSMPDYVVTQLMHALNQHRKSLNGSRVLLVGMAYKSDVDDIRESPSLKLMELLLEKGAQVDYYDPFIPRIKPTRQYPHLTGGPSIEWNTQDIAKYDAVLISTAHSCINYDELVQHAQLVIDTRNATRSVHEGREKIFKA